VGALVGEKVGLATAAVDGYVPAVTGRVVGAGWQAAHKPREMSRMRRKVFCMGYT